jgi:inhibitor of KinA sporulation pathway (predicted exonuclease)
MQISTVLDKIIEETGPLDTLVALDIEATCWDKDDPAAPGRDAFEVIEIGMVAIDIASLTITREISILIKPVEHPVLSDFCVKLTTITKDLLDGEIEDDPDATYETVRVDNFAEAMIVSKQWLGALGKFAWTSWGFYDLHQMTAEAKRKNAEMPFPAESHFNAKMIYSKTRSGVKRRGLGAAVKRQQLSFLGQQHRGVADAKNVARVILSDQGVVFDSISQELSHGH